MHIIRHSLTALLGLALLARLDAAAPEYVEGEVIVTFKSSSSQADARASLRRKSMDFARHFDRLSAKRGRQTGLIRDAGRTTAQLIATLGKLPGVESVEPNYLRRLNALPDDSAFSQLWSLRNTGQTVNGITGTPGADIHFVEADDLNRIPAGEIVLGIMDSGVDIAHPDLAANIWINPGEIPGDGIDNDGNGYIDDVHGYDFVSLDADPANTISHGTHVAGTAAAVGNNALGIIGVAHRARILPLKVGADGGDITTAAIVDALEYATALKNTGVNIVALNASFGGSGASNAERDAIQMAGDAGILLSASAGNESSNNNTIRTYPASYRLPNMIVVAASTPDDTLSTYSNYGSTTVDLAAPGDNILSTTPSSVSLKVGATSYAATRFGNAEASTGLSGTIIDCGLGNAPSDFPPQVAGNIALMLRDSTSYSTKVANAMAAGATAAIIRNSSGIAISPTSSALNTTRTDWIPAYWIGKTSGDALVSILPQPGEIVVSGKYQPMSGTSMAAPHVTGAAGLAAMNFPADSMTARRARLIAAVDTLPALQDKVVTSGRLNLLKLVDADSDGLADWRPRVTTDTLPDTIVGDPYSQTLAAAGGVAPLVWNIADGSTPDGLALDADGALAGSATEAGVAGFIVAVTDATGAVGSATFTLTVTASGPLDHFTWDHAPALAYAGRSFAVGISARDAQERVVPDAAGPVNLIAPAGITPGSVSLSAGRYVGHVQIASAADEIVLTASSGAADGASAPIDILASTSTANDGLPDAWKNLHGLATATNVADLDPDGDGLTNRQEFMAGTDPASAASTFAATTTPSGDGTHLELRWPSVAGRLYRVSTSTDLQSWTPLTPPLLPDAEGPQTYTVPLGNDPKVFFRVEITP